MGIGEVVVDLFFQTFIPQAAVEGLDIAILLRLARIDSSLLDLVVVQTLQDGVGGELGAIVRVDASWFALDPDQRIEFLRPSGPRDAGVGKQGKVLAAAFVVASQDAELPVRPKRIRREVRGAALVQAQ